MSTIDTSTWNPDADLNVEIEGIPLNADADIAQTWKVIAILMAAMKGDTNAIKAMISVMEGATASADGASGLVPKPEAGDQDKFLKGDGTWGLVEAGDVSIAWEDIEDKPSTFPPSIHTHGNVANDGKLLASGSPATDKVVVTDASGNIIATSNVSRQELGHLNGVTSNVQTQINAKAEDSGVVHKTGNETVGGNKTLSGYLIKNGALGVSGVDNGSIYVCNGTGPTDGGGVWLYGKNHENAGKVRLQSYNGTYYYYEVNSDGNSKTNTTLNIFKGNANSPGLILEGGGQNYAISVVDTSCKKGTPPSTNKYWGIDFYGEDYDSYNKRIGMVETVILKDTNKCSTSLIAYNCTTNANTETCAIRAIVDESGNKYTEAPTPSNPVDSSTKIATTAWAFPRICKYIAMAATDTVDLNDYTTPGVYQFVNNNNATFLNAPEGINGTLFVIGASNHVVRQMWFRWGTNNSNDYRVFIRQYISGASTEWSSWTRLFTDKDTIPVGNGGTGSTTKNFVDLSTNQSIDGSKTFTSEVKILKNVGTALRINASDLVKGTPPQEQKNFYIPFDDNSDGRFFALEGIVRTSGETVFRAYAFKNEASSSDATSISLVYPVSGDPYATAPSTPSTGNNTDIVTRDWMPKDTRLVHTTGNEQISGDKSFESTINIRHSTAKGTNPSGSTSYKQLNFSDSTGLNITGARASCVEGVVSTSGQTSIYMRAYNWVAGSNVNAAIAVHYPKNGTAYTEAPTPSDVADNSTKIATTAWAFPKLARFYASADSALLDLDDYVTPGVYTFNGGVYDSGTYVVANIPEGVNGTLLVIGNSSYIVRQVWFRLGTNDSTDHRIFVRQRNWMENNSWSAWTRLFTSKDTIPVANGGTGSSTKNFVDLSTNQSIGGTKTFSSTIKSTATNTIETTINATIADASRNSRLTKQLGIVTDTDGKVFAALEAEANTDGSRSIYFLMRNRANSGYISGYHLYEDSSGTVTLRLNHTIARNGTLAYSGAASGNINMFNGTQASDGAGIWLYGRTHSTRPGWANLQTSDGTNYYGFIIEPVNKYARFTNTITEVRSDNQATLGSSSKRWGQLYTTTAPDTSSDERLKQQIDSIPDDVLDAWGEVDWQQFKFNDAVEEKGADKARLHTGLIAQRIEEKFAIRGLDASRYGLFCYDEWDAQPEERNEDGQVVSEAKAAGNEYSIRYAEALCMEAAYQRRRADRLEARIKALEEMLK